MRVKRPPLVLTYQHVGISHCLVADELPARRHLFQVVHNLRPRHADPANSKRTVSRLYLRDDVAYWLFQQGIHPRNCIQFIYELTEDTAVKKRLPTSIMLVFSSKNVAMMFKLTFG